MAKQGCKGGMRKSWGVGMGYKEGSKFGEDGQGEIY